MHVAQVLQGRPAGEAEEPAHAAGGPPEGRAASQASMAAAAAEAQVALLERKARVGLGLGGVYSRWVGAAPAADPLWLLG